MGNSLSIPAASAFGPVAKGEPARDCLALPHPVRGRLARVPADHCPRGWPPPRDGSSLPCHSDRSGGIQDDRVPTAFPLSVTPAEAGVQKGRGMDSRGPCPVLRYGGGNGQWQLSTCRRHVLDSSTPPLARQWGSPLRMTVGSGAALRRWEWPRNHSCEGRSPGEGRGDGFPKLKRSDLVKVLSWGVQACHH